MQDGRQASFLFLPEGEDPRQPGAAHRCGCVSPAGVRCHAAVLEYLFEHYGQTIDLEHLDGRARPATCCCPRSTGIPGAVFRELMRTALAERVGMAANRLPQAPGQAPLAASTADRRYVACAPAGDAPTNADTRCHDTAQGPRLDAARHTAAAAAPRAGHAHPRTSSGSKRWRIRTSLLRQLVKQLERTPHTSLGAMLGYWYGTESGELLTRLAAEDPMPGADPERSSTM